MLDQDQDHPAEASDGRLPAGARQARLIDLLRRTGFVSVAESAERMGVSSMTLRRDLEALARLAAPGAKIRTSDGKSGEKSD